MDARERLRRYLEQRRELGESELVLDSIPVDDVLRMIGARTRPARHAATERTATAAANTSPSPGAASETAPAPGRDRANLEPLAVPPPAPPPVPTMRTADAPPVSDWRAALANSKPAATPPSANQNVPPSARRAEAPATPPSAGAATTPAWLVALDIPFGLHAGADTLRGHASRLDQRIADLPSLDAIAQAVAGCTRCPLHATALNPVPGGGNPDADFVCVGEAPGQNEDEQGRPFVGAAGQLLTKILGAIKLSREDVFICNVLKHRPPGNRDPLPDEVHACTPYLLRQLDLVRPRVILALGSFAARTLLGTDQTIGRLRGRVHFYHGIPLIATYHPAALLRNEAWKRPAWEDVQLARRIYDAARGATSTSS